MLRTGQEKLSDKGIVSAAKRVDPLRRQTRLPRAEIIDALAGHFRRRYGLTPDTVTGGELRAARDLARNEVRQQRVDRPGAMTTPHSGARTVTDRSSAPAQTVRATRVVLADLILQ